MRAATVTRNLRVQVTSMLTGSAAQVMRAEPRRRRIGETRAGKPERKAEAWFRARLV